MMNKLCYIWIFALTFCIFFDSFFRFCQFPTDMRANMKGETLIVETKYGPVRGLKRTSAVDDQFFSFRGIPYAKQPIGELRFKDPQPVVPWTEPIDATVAGFSAPSLSTATTVGGNENCLTLNIYTKEISPRKPLPVMVWIHGGGFKYGDSSEMFYGPDYLLAKDVVYVSMNYRLGVLGFLSIDDPSVNIPGNAGLKDQRLALKWIRENVQCFGGDHKNITVFGESAGAGSIHMHMLSDLSKGLFDKAIVQSGSALAPWCNTPRKNWPERIAKKLGWDGVGGAPKLVEFLSNADVTDLILAQETRTVQDKRNWILTEWAPSVEPYVSEQSIITKSPFETYKSAWGNKIPLIIGGTTDEGLLSYREIMADPELYKGERAFENLIPEEWGPIDKIKDLVDTLKTFYFDEGAEIEATKFLNILSDKYFWHGIHLAILGRLQDVNSGSTYMYRYAFSADLKFNLIRPFLVPNEVKGVCHAEEIISLFKPAMGNEPTINSAEHKTIDRLTSLFTRFAATGDPNCDIIKPIVWKPIVNRSSPPFKCLNIDDELSFIFYPESKRMALWTSIQS